MISSNGMITTEYLLKRMFQPRSFFTTMAAANFKTLAFVVIVAVTASRTIESYLVVASGINILRSVSLTCSTCYLVNCGIFPTSPFCCSTKY